MKTIGTVVGMKKRKNFNIIEVAVDEKHNLKKGTLLLIKEVDIVGLIELEYRRVIKNEFGGKVQTKNFE